MPTQKSSQKGSIALMAAIIGIGVLTLGIFAGKRLVSQGPRLSPLAITPTINPACMFCENDDNCLLGNYCTEESYCRPSCLNAVPPCLMPEPLCPSITPSGTPFSTKTPTPTPCAIPTLPLCISGTIQASNDPQTPGVCPPKYVCMSPTPTPTLPTDLIPGDANEDKIVDGLDYVIWLIHYNQETANKHKYGDFDGNGKVDGLDYVNWLNQYFLFHPKPSPIPTCIPPPPCIYGEKQPDGTIIYCDPPPWVIFCPVSPTPTVNPTIYPCAQIPETCIKWENGVPQVICMSTGILPWCPVPTCTPRPACLDTPPYCLLMPKLPNYCPPKITPVPNPSCYPLPDYCISWENGVAKNICRATVDLFWCPLPTCTLRPSCLDEIPACEIPEMPYFCPPVITL